jgi:hypothetical protein
VVELDGDIATVKVALSDEEIAMPGAACMRAPLPAAAEAGLNGGCALVSRRRSVPVGE